MPLKNDFYFSRKAFIDLHEIWNYTNFNWSLRQADRYFTLIFEEINHICLNPDSGRNIDFIKKDYRSSRVKSHLIIYKVLSSKIKIVRILHEKMDIKNRLK